MTSLIRFTPRHDMRRLQCEFDHLFESFFPTRPAGGDEALESAVWAPRTDLSETENAYFIYLDLPGLKKGEVEINVHDGTLSVSGERRQEEAEEGRTFVRVERAYGRFYRSFSLPQTIDAASIEATFEDGVLTIEVPKAEELKPRRIDIR